MLCIRALTVADTPFVMRLKAEAGWNQLEADCLRLHALQPDGGFVAELDGAAVGTVTTCCFGPVAWVAMMLVDQRYRSRGIGRALMVHALDTLDEKGVQSIRLDATPMGRPLYESLGFVFESSFLRFQGISAPCSTDAATALPVVAAAELLDALIAFDRDVTGTDRARLLRRLAEEHGDSLRVVHGAGGRGIRGFLMSRPGAHARQLGPCLAEGDAGPLLFAHARQCYGGQSLFIDLPEDNPHAAAEAASMGLVVGRRLSRMGRGPHISEDRTRLWASAGPEKG